VEKRIFSTLKIRKRINRNFIKREINGFCL
jgi:hypothetical protein